MKGEKGKVKGVVSATRYKKSHSLKVSKSQNNDDGIMGQWDNATSRPREKLSHSPKVPKSHCLKKGQERPLPCKGNLASEGCRVLHSAKMPSMGSTQRTSH